MNILIPAPSVESLMSYHPGNCWPLQSHLQLPALPPAVPSARLHARKMLTEWGLETEAVELIVSELVTNSVWASRGVVPVRLWICSDRRHVAVQVWDASDRMPVRRDPGADELGGRGLMIVDALSEDWGSYRPASLCGKVVWAVTRIECVH